MKKITLLLVCLLFIVFVKAQSDSAQIIKEKFEPINLWFVMLTKGAIRNQDSITAQKLQDGHMANMGKKHKEGKLLVAGPFLEDSNWRGIFILKCDNKEEAEALVQQDPAVIAGRLSYEIHPWMTGKNCLFK